MRLLVTIGSQTLLMPPESELTELNADNAFLIKLFSLVKAVSSNGYGAAKRYTADEDQEADIKLVPESKFDSGTDSLAGKFAEAIRSREQNYWELVTAKDKIKKLEEELASRGCPSCTKP